MARRSVANDARNVAVSNQQWCLGDFGLSDNRRLDRRRGIGVWQGDVYKYSSSMAKGRPLTTDGA
jgi:hypothetical protein